MNAEQRQHFRRSAGAYCIKIIHDYAMNAAQNAEVARRYNSPGAPAWARIAAFYEVRAADKIAATEGDTEPTRAILHYSAGFCALKAGDVATATRMMERGRETVRHGHPSQRLDELESALEAEQILYPDGLFLR
jgi:hypothetical protein